MNVVARDFLRLVEEDEYLMHYGTKRHSGRYPWGSGEDPYQHENNFLSRVNKMRADGISDTDIARSMKMSTGDFRKEIAIVKDEKRIYDVNKCKALYKKGYNKSEISRMTGLPDTTVGLYLKAGEASKLQEARNTAKFIKSQVDKKGMVDVGKGVERELNISKTKLDQALYLLEREGYPIYKGGVKQVTNPGKQTTQTVICKPGTPHKAIYELDKVHALNEDNYISHDGGDTFDRFQYPASMDSKRLKIRYAEDGGNQKDGLIEIRRGVDDLSLGEDHFAQVRILVDGKKYLKGMAIYSDDLPEGTDIIFNTNKHKDTPKLEVLKDITNDPDNPFGSLIKEQGGQSYYFDKDGNRHLSLINKRAAEGDWMDWQDKVPSQFLSKQDKELAKRQLNLAKADKQVEFEDIKSLNNPTIKKHLLEKFADECDSAAVDLKAAAFPGQKYNVLIPVTSMKDNEVYAPRYENGTKLALIRYPHGGTFEIPILTVNNKQPDARKALGNTPIDAVCVNSKVAERLSGADFDGDTVMCIPTNDRQGKVKIKSTDPLIGLEGFDPKSNYIYDKKTVTKDKDGKDVEHYFRDGREFKVMSNTGTQMGIISNLITDMTLKGATSDELARAVRHSMVVIDAEKHKLDYKQSEIDNNIAQLHEKYQGKKGGGASTIISRAKGEISVPARKGSPKINIKGEPWYDPSKPEGSYIWKLDSDRFYPVRRKDNKTNEIIFTTTDNKPIRVKADDKEAYEKYAPIMKENKDGSIIFTNKDGTIQYKYKQRMQPSVKMRETDDAYSLVSKQRNDMEVIYADYANSMKVLANDARKELYSTGNLKYDPKAKAQFQKEYDSLMSKLNEALLNNPREREAQRRANTEVQAKIKADPSLKPKDIKKLNQQAISKYRNEVGSIKRRDRNIEITDKEWEAIQSGAITENKLKKILDNTNIDSLRERATPRTSKTELSNAKQNKIRLMANSHYTIDEIAKSLGVSPSTVSKYLKGE